MIKSREINDPSQLLTEGTETQSVKTEKLPHSQPDLLDTPLGGVSRFSHVFAKSTEEGHHDRSYSRSQVSVDGKDSNHMTYDLLPNLN